MSVNKDYHQLSESEKNEMVVSLYRSHSAKPRLVKEAMDIILSEYTKSKGRYRLLVRFPRSGKSSDLGIRFSNINDAREFITNNFDEFPYQTDLVIASGKRRLEVHGIGPGGSGRSPYYGISRD